MYVNMRVPDIIIAVDGYSSTGKSTFAKLVAEKFSFLYLDSGALYRAVTLYSMENGLIGVDGVIDNTGLQKSIEDLDIRFVNKDGINLTYIGERCVEKEIRSLSVSNLVSPISAVPFVRTFVDNKLHALSSAGRVVMDGRDIGTTVFPKAQLKIFMTARPEVRAKRRYDEMVAKGETVKFEDVLENLNNRDKIDSSRKTSPLSRPLDAFVLDNSDMTLKEELTWMQGVIQGKFGILE